MGLFCTTLCVWVFCGGNAPTGSSSLVSNGVSFLEWKTGCMFFPFDWRDPDFKTVIRDLPFDAIRSGTGGCNVGFR